MIVREEPDGSLILIAQPDHATVSGVFAARWGNARFDRPRRYESTVRAATFHDSGWYRYQTAPRLMGDSGKAANFMQVPLDPEQLEAFQWVIDWLTNIDPYAGLLISKHRTGLWRDRYNTVRHPAGFTARNPDPAVEHFTLRNEARQAQEIKAFDEAEFRVNFHWLQVWDLLSLYFCMRPPGEDYIDPVPARYSDGAGVGAPMTLRPLGGPRVAIDPYPFDTPTLPFSVVCRRLPVSTFPDVATFREAYFKAAPELLTFELVPA